MPKLTDEQTENLVDLRKTLAKALSDAQTITVSFDDDDHRGDDFYEYVEMKIDETLHEVDEVLKEDSDA